MQANGLLCLLNLFFQVLEDMYGLGSFFEFLAVTWVQSQITPVRASTGRPTYP